MDWSEEILQHFLSQNSFSKRFFFHYDLDVIDERLQTLVKLFPEGSLFCFPVKTAPLPKLLERFNNSPNGAEAASIGELIVAKKAGFKNEQLVFDAPLKFEEDIEYFGVNFPGSTINFNDLGEVDTYIQLLPNNPKGLRINPLTSPKAEAKFNVSGTGSKFGELISNRDQILKAFKSHQDLTCLHVHQASNFLEFETIIEGIKKVVELADEINIESQQVTTINIGGGFRAEVDTPHSLKDFVDALKKAVPQLFSDYKIITEFGRWTFKESGTAFAQVGKIKNNGDHQLVYCKASANAFLREIYQPEKNDLKPILLTAHGKAKLGALVQQKIDGPLCFAGDRIGHSISIPEAKELDWIVFKNVGANTLGLWSNHCTQPFPFVLGTSKNTHFTIHQGQSWEDAANLWG